MLLLPMFRHGGVCAHAGLVQAFQLLERHLKVVPDQSSHVPLSRGEEADRAFVDVEQFEARSADHVTMTGNPEQLSDQIGLSVGGISWITPHPCSRKCVASSLTTCCRLPKAVSAVVASIKYSALEDLPTFCGRQFEQCRTQLWPLIATLQFGFLTRRLLTYGVQVSVPFADSWQNSTPDVLRPHSRPWWNSYIPATALIALGPAILRNLDSHRPHNIPLVPAGY